MTRLGIGMLGEGGGGMVIGMTTRRRRGSIMPGPCRKKGGDGGVTRGIMWMRRRRESLGGRDC